MTLVSMDLTREWYSVEEAGPTGVGGQVWVAYPNPVHPDGWMLRVQWTPIQSELSVPPLFWKPLASIPLPICPECRGRGEILDAPGDVLSGHPYWTPCPVCRKLMLGGDDAV